MNSRSRSAAPPEYSRFMKMIDSGSLPPVVLLHGDESHLISQCVHAAVRKVLGDDTGSFNLFNARADECKIEDVGSFLSNMSLLGGAKIAVIRDIVPWLKNRAFAALVSEQCSSDGAGQVYLVLTAPGTPISRISGETGKVLKKPPVSQSVDIFYMTGLKGVALDNWLRAELKKRKLETTKKPMDFLKTATGGSMARLSMELDKLNAYLGPKERKLRLEHVMAMAVPGHEDNVFAFTDLVFSGRDDKALEMLRKLSRSGTSTGGLGPMLATMYLRMNLVKHAASQRLPNEQAMAVTGVKSPWYLSRLKSMVSSRSPDSLSNALHTVLENELGQRSGRYDPQTALDLLAVKLSRNRN